MEKGSAELEQFQKIHGFISDQLFSDFVSDSFIPFFHMKASIKCLLPETSGKQFCLEGIKDPFAKQ